MTKSSLRAKLLGALCLSAFFLIGLPAAQAIDFQDEVDKAVAADAMKAAQSSALKSLFGTAKKLPGLKMTNVKAANGALTGDVNFIKQNRNLAAYSGGGAKLTFIAFGPKKIFNFKDIFRKAPRIELLDTIKFEDQPLTFAVGDIEIEAKDLPANVRSITDKFFE